MKKLLPILLAVAMVMTLGLTAFATTLTVEGDRTYNGYQLLTLTTSLKAECGCSEHSDDCYNYAYAVNEDYRGILKTVAGVGEDVTDADAIDAAILEFFAAKSDDEMREVADDIFEALAGVEADVKGLTGANNDLAQGYWLFADVTDLDDKNLANSLVLIDTVGQDSITITPKTDLPTVEKKVKDINDSTDADYTDWQDSADYDIGDDVPFKLTATLPDNVANYDSYEIIFHDTICDGLTADLENVTVKIYADEDDTTGTDVTTGFTVIEDCDCGCSFAVVFDNVLDLGATKDSIIVVYYNAELNEDAAIGATGNPNEVYLEFSNNPYDEGTGKTEEDKVIVFTYEVVIDKVDAQGNALAGAEFELSKWDGEAWVALTVEVTNGTTFTWTGLDDGMYKLVETVVPAGYNGMDPIEFEITATHDEEADEPALTALEVNVDDLTADVATGVINGEIVNRSGSVLPETGAKGTVLLIGCSAILVMLAAVFMVTRKKMSVYED